MLHRPYDGIIRMLVQGALCLGLCTGLGSAHGQDTRQVSEPKLPQVCASLPARLAAGHGTLPESAELQLDTARIQEAIDHCIAGRAVELRPEGDHNAFLSGPLELRPSVTLLVAAGATLFATRDARAYDVRPGLCGTVNQEGRGCKPLIHAPNAPHSGVMGEGAIDGQGGEHLLGRNVSWWDLAHQAKVEDARQNCPRLVVADASDDFTLYGITLRNSPNFHVIVNRSNGFTAWGVRIDAPATARNTDGIDPASSTNVTIAHSYIRAGDDNVAIKAGNAGPAAHITIAHNHFYSGHGMSIGSETNGGVNNVLVRDLTIDGADNGIRIKSDKSRGGLVRDVAYEDVCMREVKHPLLLTPFYSAAAGDLVPKYEGIVLHAIHDVSPGQIDLLGFDGDHLLEVKLDGVFMDHVSAKNVNLRHARLAVGAEGVSFPLEGEDIRATAAPRNAKMPGPLSCQAAFVPFPAEPVIHPQRKTFNDEEPRPFSPPSGTRQTVTAAADGSGDYRSVQEGIDALRQDGGTVLIKPGIYREVVRVAKPHVRLQGLSDDATKTVIVNSNSAGSSGGTFLSATVFVTADDFSASNLTFENDFSKQHGLQPQGSQAVALSVRGDRAVFRNMRFLGAQDTLFAASRSCETDQGPCRPARQYFQNCYVEGNVDFIFGDAKAVFDHCVIHAIDHQQVMITAQSKRYPGQDSGYVFDHCRITSASGVGRIFLGRPWRPYATVIFLNSDLDEKVDPAGWAEWHPGETKRLETAFYAEYGSTGAGAGVTRRDPHSRQLDDSGMTKYLVQNFLAGLDGMNDGWNPGREGEGSRGK